MPGTTIIYRLYRGIHGTDPQPEHFYSNKRAGKKPRRIERENPREYEAVSLWDTLEKVCEWARVYPQIGDHVAELHIPDGAPIVLKEEGDPGHWNAWGEPEDFLPFVKAIHPVHPGGTPSLVDSEYTGGMSYTLLELSTGNVVGFFTTERDALDEVLDSITMYGEESVASLALGFNDPTGPVRAIAEGQELARRALATAGHGREVVVHGQNGKARSSDSYSPKPTPPGKHR